jgi:iron(III) transport system substrate-binding protein
MSNNQRYLSFRLSRLISVCLSGLLVLSACSHQAFRTGSDAERDKLVASAVAEGEVIIYSVLSTRAAQPMIDHFESLYPGIKVSYDGDSGSTETDARFRAELATSGKSADVMWSSAMDLQLQLVREGYAASYRSAESSELPASAIYKDKAFGTTLEPVVFVYNTDLLKGADIPLDHKSFGDLVESRPDRFRGKVTSFDIEQSGVGYMLAVRDKVENPDIADLRAQLTCADARTSAGTGAMLTSIDSGEYLLGYNVMGAYALSRSESDLPRLGIVYPSDYTIALSRVMFVSAAAKHPNAARLWLDYTLSDRGQAVLADQLKLYPVKPGIDAKQSLEILHERVGNGLRPIPVDLSLTDPLTPSAKESFLQFWQAGAPSKCPALASTR